MKFGSLFTGIGGFDLGFERAGLSCAWQCEIDRAASSILARHWGNLFNYHDVKKISRSGSAAAGVDVLCGGFPCQDLSVAGRRAGLAGARSGLWWQFRRIARRLRPQFVVIENVPGLLSSNEGRDFAVLLRGLVKLGYGLAWRVLDSQYDRVAQRRRRVFIVGSLGDGRAAQILFEPESLRWNSAPRREAGQKPAPTLGCGPVSGGRKYGTDADSCESLIVGTMRGNGDAHSGFEHGDGIVVGTLTPGAHPGGFNGQDAYSGHIVPIPFDTTQITSKGNYSNPQPGDPCHPLAAGMHAPAIAHTLRAEGFDASARDATDSTLIPVGIDGSGLGFALRSSASHSGDKGDGGMNVTTVVHAYGISSDCLDRSGEGAGGTAGERSGLGIVADQSPTLRAKGSSAVGGTMGVRRLTPRECERLQSFPDDWTRWTASGKEQADGPRYKQLGNAVTVNVAQWLGKRILSVLSV